MMINGKVKHSGCNYCVYKNVVSGEVDQTSDPTGIRAAIREIDQKPWREVETENMIEPSIIVAG